MVKSMTGYGKAQGEFANRMITVEIRSLNGKQLDLSVRTPMLYRQLEYDIRSRASKCLVRGKVEINVSIETAGNRATANINRDLFAAYRQAICQLIDGSDVVRSPELDAAILTSVLRMPDVISSDDNQLSDEEREFLFSLLDSALLQFDRFREHEGGVLIADLLKRVDLIESYKAQVEPYEKERIETIKNRIRDQIAQLNVAVDDNRLEQEMIFYVEKLDITEEKVRLDKHCNYFRNVSNDEENVGRKLGFVAQEMGREINTLGSKANNSEMQILVVKMKDELEKIKEQVLNIL